MFYKYFYHFYILFGNVDWLKTGHMTFYKKLYRTDVTNYSNTKSSIARMLLIIVTPMQYFFFLKFLKIKKFPKISTFSKNFKMIKFSKNFKNFKVFIKFQNFNI